MVCQAFNADFDGDQMAVHLPLTDEAQDEARLIMHSPRNLLKPATGEPIVNPDKDMVLGCYFATTIAEGKKGEGKLFTSDQEALLAYDFKHVDLQARVKVRLPKAKLEGKKPVDSAGFEMVETNVGRILFNRALPDDFPYVNAQLKKRDLAEILTRVIKRYGIEGAPPILDNIKNFGFAHATYSGHTWALDD